LKKKKDQKLFAEFFIIQLRITTACLEYRNYFAD